MKNPCPNKPKKKKLNKNNLFTTYMGVRLKTKYDAHFYAILYTL